MKTKLLILLTALSLQGCLWQTTSVVDIEKAIDYCKDKGGLYEIDVLCSGSELAICIDREYKVSKDLDLYLMRGK